MEYINIENFEKWTEVLSVMNNDRFMTENGMETNDLAEYIGVLLGIEHYDHGVGRACYGFGEGKIIKIATSKRGIEDNYIEQKIWVGLPEELRDNFAKCYAVGYGWGIFEYIEGFIDFCDMPKYYEDAKKIIEKMESHNIYLKDVGTKTLYKNWGLRGNTLVIFDYAT